EISPREEGVLQTLGVEAVVARGNARAVPDRVLNDLPPLRWPEEPLVTHVLARVVVRRHAEDDRLRDPELLPEQARDPLVVEVLQEALGHGDPKGGRPKGKRESVRGDHRRARTEAGEIGARRPDDPGIVIDRDRGEETAQQGALGAAADSYLQHTALRPTRDCL